MCHGDLGRVGGDLLEELVILQHALKHKEELSVWMKLQCFE